MHRRKFLASSLAATAAAAATTYAAIGKDLAAQTPAAQSSGSQPREFYQLRRYHLQSGPQSRLTSSYIADALIPALSRQGMGPIGAFNLTFGPETPSTYVLIPSTNLEALATIDLHLSTDADFVKQADAFWNAPAVAPAFIRVEYSLLSAFPGWPRITPSPAIATKAKRIYQLRTYESPSYGDHVRKVEMFHNGEFSYFQKAGFNCVFFGDTLIGQQMPNLTYMLSFENIAQHDALWAAFGSDPDWKKLSADKHYAFESIVSNVTNLILSPLACSQV
jgi:hypothetical protein